MKLHSNIYGVKTVCLVQKWLFSFPQFLSYCHLISCFTDYPCARHNKVTVRNILTLYSRVNEVKTACRVQKLTVLPFSITAL